MSRPVRDDSFPLRVVKLGGSLLSARDWPSRLHLWLAGQPPARNLILVGGGAPVDAVRELAAVAQYDQQFLHWLCIDLMDISSRLVSHQFPEWPVLKTDRDLQNWLMCKVIAESAIVRVGSFYRAENCEHLPIPLPLSWDTTSDSLAALLARLVDADDCVLLKSCLLEQNDESPAIDWLELAEAGIVDRALPMAIVGLRCALRIANC